MSAHGPRNLHVPFSVVLMLFFLCTLGWSVVGFVAVTAISPQTIEACPAPVNKG